MSRATSKTPAALRDLNHIAATLSESNLRTANRFLSSAEATFERLADMPGLGSPCLIEYVDQPIRVWPVRGFRNYLVFYREVDTGIEVIRILHGARDWQAILGG